MKTYVIQAVRNLVKIPHLKWVIFQVDKTEALFCPCCKDILIDVLNEQSSLHRLRCLVHELTHYLFSFLPEQLYHTFSKYLDVTDGNRPFLLYEDDDDSMVVIHIFD